MPNIIQSLIPNFAGDTVLVTDSNGNRVFPLAKAMKVEVRPYLEPMENPLEFGATITDHVIYKPIEIEIAMILQSRDYKDTYKEIVHYFRNAISLIIQCRAGNFTNQIIQALPHQEDAEHMDALLVALRFKETLIAATTNPTAINSGVSSYQPSVDRGTQTGTVTEATLQTATIPQIQAFARNAQVNLVGFPPIGG